jgi:Ribbon-helix-helix protein, copG family
MKVIEMPRPERAERRAYGETKKPRQFMITDWASEALDKLAEEMGTTRSEVLERAIRCGGLEVAKKYNPETGECCQ